MKTTKLFKRLLLAAAMMALLPQWAAAYDFMVDGIAFNKNSDDLSVSVTSTGTDPNYNGVTTLNIPPTVSYGGKTYNVTAIGYYGLAGAESIESLTLPEGLVSIGECGLNSLRSLRQLTLPSTLMTVSGWAFENLDNVQNITSLATTAPTISGFWFHNTNLLPTCPFYVPAGSLSSYQASSYWKAFNLVENTVLATSVSLNQTSARIYPGETLQLVATVLPENTSDKSVSWRSSNTNVVTVDQNGVVTAKAVGWGIITVTTADGTNLSASCVVSVMSPPAFGDVNNDGVVDIADVNIVLNYMLGKSDPRATYEQCDLNEDGVVDIADVNIVINAMLGKSIIPNGFTQLEYIDVTGGQWIDTGILADATIQVEFTTMIAGRMAGNTRFFSTHDKHPNYSETTTGYYDGWNASGTWGLSAEPNILMIKPLGYTNLVETDCQISDYYNQKITFLLDGMGRFSLIKDGQTVKSYDASSLTNASTTSQTDLRLFTRVTYDNHELFKGKVYEVTIKKSDRVVMHLLPYWDNNQDVGVFYDTVSKKAFYSDSQKSF